MTSARSLAPDRLSVKLHLRDGRTDRLSARPSLGWSLTLSKLYNPHHAFNHVHSLCPHRSFKHSNCWRHILCRAL